MWPTKKEPQPIRGVDCNRSGHGSGDWRHDFIFLKAK